MWLPYASTCTWSSSAEEARPVRRPPSSCLSEPTAPCMRRLRSFMSNVAAAMVSSAIRGSFVCMVAAPSADRGEVTLAAQDSLDRAGQSDRKNNDRHTVLSSKRERGGIHDFQVAVERFLVAEMLVALGARIAFGIRSIDPVDVGRLEHRI